MSNLPLKVQPGDLITSDLMNRFLRELSDLEERVSLLEGGTPAAGQVVITDVLPGTLLQERQEVQIKGRNFDFSIGAQRVYFATQPVEFYKLGSSDNLLVVDVPTIPGLPTLGGTVTLTVSNKTTTATRQVTVIPVTQEISGPVDAESKRVEPDPIVAGLNADFPFLLTSRASGAPADFSVTAALTGVSWQDRVRILDSDKSVLSESKVRLTRNLPKLIYARINPVPSDAGSATFDIVLKVKAGKAGGDSGVKTYVVGQATPPEDNTISLKGPSSDPPGAYSNGVISLAIDSGASIKVTVETQVSGSYQVSARRVADSPGGTPVTKWDVSMLTPTPDNPADPSIGTVQITGSKIIEFWVEPKANAEQSGRVQLKVQRQGAATGKTLNFNLQKL